MSKLAHLLELVIMLQYKEFTTASKLADILDVDKKTVYRYIDALQVSNIPVESKKGRYGGFYINRNFYMKYPNLEIKELEALTMASKILTKENGFFYGEEFQSAVTKIKNTFLRELDKSHELREDSSFVLKDIGSIETFDNIIAKINFAMSKGKILSITYFSLNKNSTTKSKVNPYDIFFRKGNWYMVAYCNTLGREMIFKISSIKSIQISNDIFIKPKNFNLKEYLNNSSEDFMDGEILVKIKFDKSIAAFISENQWSKNQEVEHLQNGDVVLNILLDELGEIKKWILGFGSSAEVLQPVELRSEIMSEMDKGMKKYSKNFD